MPPGGPPRGPPGTARRKYGSRLVDGTLAAGELRAQLGLSDVPGEAREYQTVGGMVTGTLGIDGWRVDARGHLKNLGQPAPPRRMASAAKAAPRAPTLLATRSLMASPRPKTTLAEKT